jgi:hypothetical protein
MTKQTANPFDDFPEDGTPMLFHDRMEQALAWLEPHLDESDINHQTLLGNCKYYSRLLHDPALYPHDDESLQKTLQEVVYRQSLIVNIFGRVRGAVIASEAISRVKGQSEAQSKRASKPRAFEDEQQAKRAAKAYHDIKAGRAEYGGVKALAARYKVTEATIRAVARRYPADSIDQ